MYRLVARRMNGQRETLYRNRRSAAECQELAQHYIAAVIEQRLDVVAVEVLDEASDKLIETMEVPASYLSSEGFNLCSQGV